jgi:hypothetical protein
MTDHEDFNQPGVNLLDIWLVKDLQNVDPRSLFAWTFRVNGTEIIQYITRAEFIRLLILEKQDS